MPQALDNLCGPGKPLKPRHRMSTKSQDCFALALRA